MNRLNMINKNIAFVLSVTFVAVMALFLSVNKAEACYNNHCYSTYPTYPSSPTSPLGISCYSSPTTAQVGSDVVWTASPYGGNQNYYITWSGNDGLSGYGTSIYKSYNTPGSKYASVTVTSAGQTASANCGNNVLVYDNYNNNSYPNYNYNYNTYPNYNYNYNSYPNYNYNYGTPLYISCTSNTSYANLGTSVIWQSTVSGGTGYYTYNWYGTDYLNGSGQNTSAYYNTPGTKTASVTVSSGNQTITQSCSNSVAVGTQVYNNNNNNNGLQIACYADRTSARIGTPVKWAVEVVGGSGNYTYSWSGTEGLSSNQSSVIMSYGSTGAKTASVTITSNGQSASQSCGNLVTITNGSAAAPIVKTAPPKDNDQSAAALFSLKNVPWGLVALLIIIIMFIVICYLIYNRNKV